MSAYVVFRVMGDHEVLRKNVDTSTSEADVIKVGLKVRLFLYQLDTLRGAHTHTHTPNKTHFLCLSFEEASTHTHTHTLV